MISQRTFFNYAGSKEGAILGIESPMPGEKLCAEFIAGRGGNPLQDLVGTLARAFQESGLGNSELFGKRREIIHSNPQLAIKEFARMDEARTAIVGLVIERLCSDAGADASSELTEGATDDDAGMIVSLTFGIMHSVVREWIVTGFPNNVEAVLAAAVERAQRLVGALVPDGFEPPESAAHTR